MNTTRRWALALLLASVSASSLAEWTEIEKFDDGMRVFVDPATVHRTGDTAQLLHLVRWGEPQLEPGSPNYLSTVVRSTYDCIGKREKYLASTSFSGTMGNGAIVISDEDAVDHWYSISASSLEEKLWKLACAIK